MALFSYLKDKLTILQGLVNYFAQGWVVLARDEMSNSRYFDWNIYPQTMHQYLRWIEPATIEKHVEKGHVTHVESNGSRDVNIPDCGDWNNTKCVLNNTVAASFSYENQKGLFTNIHTQG